MTNSPANSSAMPRARAQARSSTLARIEQHHQRKRSEVERAAILHHGGDFGRNIKSWCARPSEPIRKPILRLPPPRKRPRAGASSSVPTASTDRKSTRLNSSHSQISYAVFCLKKKKHNAHILRVNIV